MVSVKVFKIFSDNYAYLLMDTESKNGVLVDVAEPHVIWETLQTMDINITHILTTHSHADHDGGNLKMKSLVDGKQGSNVPIVGGKGDGVQGCTLQVEEGDIVPLGSFSIRVSFTPCHTKGHVLYTCEGNCFTGDTLFIAGTLFHLKKYLNFKSTNIGCGNLNQGTAAQMHYALNDVIATLPLDTKLYVGHEYTVKNLQFAATVEPENGAVLKKLEWALAQRKAGEGCVPSIVREELATNPFMRVAQDSVKAFANREDPIDVLATVRKRKDVF